MQIENVTAGVIARTYTRQAGSANDGDPVPLRRSERRPRIDSVSLSPTTRQLTRILGAVADQDDVRAERVAAIKSAIANGSYQVDTDALAAKLMG